MHLLYYLLGSVAVDVIWERIYFIKCGFNSQTTQKILRVQFVQVKAQMGDSFPFWLCETRQNLENVNLGQIFIKKLCYFINRIAIFYHYNRELNSLMFDLFMTFDIIYIYENTIFYFYYKLGHEAFLLQLSYLFIRGPDFAFL